MIILSRLNGSIVAINPDLITWIDITPDTTVSLVGGDKIIVREPLADVIERVIEFRRATGGSPAAVAHSAMERIELAHREGSSPGATTLSPPHSAGDRASAHFSSPPARSRSNPPTHGNGRER